MSERPDDEAFAEETRQHPERFLDKKPPESR